MSGPNLVQVLRYGDILELVKHRFPFVKSVQLGNITSNGFESCGGSYQGIQVTWPADSPEGVTKKDRDLLEKDVMIADVLENVKYHRSRCIEAQDLSDKYHRELMSTNKRAKRYGWALILSNLVSVTGLLALGYRLATGG